MSFRKKKSITCAMLGLPNAGKSSLINALFGQDLSVVGPWAQITRNRFHCIFTVDQTEVILMDTPGLHQRNWEINKRMNQQAQEGAEEAQIRCLLMDVSSPLSLRQQLKEGNASLKGALQSSGPIWLIFTKSDLLGPPEKRPIDLASSLDEIQKDLAGLLSCSPASLRHFLVSAKTGEGLHLLMGALCDMAPKRPHRYPPGAFSNKREDFFMAEYIREQAFELLKDEIPYEVAAIIDQWEDYQDEKTGVLMRRVWATILVNRPSQRAIVVGQKGKMIKEIGMRARKRIQEMPFPVPRNPKQRPQRPEQVHLNLHVKVAPHWFKNNLVLEELGLPRAIDSIGVWRKK